MQQDRCLIVPPIDRPSLSRKRSSLLAGVKIIVIHYGTGFARYAMWLMSLKDPDYHQPTEADLVRYAIADMKRNGKSHILRQIGAI